MKKFKENIASHLSTIIGAIIAIATAWLDIDWSDFDVKKEWPKLALSGIIALGGYATSINILKPKQ